jgi:hypothetical protein
MGSPVTSIASGISTCADSDRICMNFDQLLDRQQPEKIIEQYDSSIQYSEASLRQIGEAYLMLASRDNISPELEESYYRKALEVKYNISYMGLYFFHVQKDEEKALGFLREYVKHKPADSAPYLILGESELSKRNYELADRYFRMAKIVTHAHSARVDWLLFQTNYILNNYVFAKEMFESAVTHGKFDKEIKALLSDPRFAGIDKRPEFMQYQNLLKVAHALY